MPALGQRLNHVMVGLLLAGVLGGCSLREEEAIGPPPEGPQILTGWASLGPISGGGVSLFTLDGTQVGASADTTLYDEAIDTITYGDAAGMRLASRIDEGRMVGAFTLVNNERAIKNSDLVLVQVDGGRDIDPNDDGVIDPNATEGSAGPLLKGSFYAVVYYEDLRNGDVVINPLSTMGYAGVTDITDPVSVATALDSYARYLFKDGVAGDINQDGSVDLRDLYAFDPSVHVLGANGPERVHDRHLRRLASFTELLPDNDPATDTLIDQLYAGARITEVAAWMTSRFGSYQGRLNPFIDLETVDIDGDGLVGADDLDSDNDGMPDTHELALGLNMWFSDAAVDDDGDGLSNVQEYNGGVNSTDPFNPDSDGDGLSDGQERTWGLDPLTANAGDSDNDGLSDSQEVARGTDPLDINNPSSDIDGDGLSNDVEMSFGYDHLDINSPTPDIDNDNIDNNTELANGLDPLVANLGDTDGDGLTDFEEIDGATITINGSARVVTSDPLLIDSDADGIDDGLEVLGYPLYDGVTMVKSDPRAIDSDGDHINDGAEKGVQDNFAAYAAPAAAGDFLLKLRPDQTTPLNLDGLTITSSANTDNGSGMEDDPDGDGKPTIEELYHGKKPNTATDTFNYINEADAGVWQAMTTAHFRYIPGGFDVDRDGSAEGGYWLAQFEARPNIAPIARRPASPAVLFSGTTDYLGSGRIVDAVGVYQGDPDGNGVFDDNARYSGVLCNSATGDAVRNEQPTTDCIANKVVTSWPLSMDYATYGVNFDPAGMPYQINVSWLDARMAVLDPTSAVANGKRIDLPSERQWVQVMQLVVNDPENWTSARRHAGHGSLASGGHKLMRGHSNGTGALGISLDPDLIENGYEGTGGSNNNNGFYDAGEELRRTHLIRNGVVARDFRLPLDYEVVLWDLSGNLWEWTRDVAFVGDNHQSGLGDASASLYTDSSPDRMSSWLKPDLGAGEVVDSAGVFMDASTSLYSRFNIIDWIGAADGSFYDNFSSLMRGGCFTCGDAAGVAALSLEFGPGGALRGDNRFGFRAASR